MCGIVGVYPLNRRTKTILMFGAYDMEERGDDSWGISNGTAIYKAVGPVTGGYRIPHNFQEGDAVVLHTRAASVGSVSVENSHPFRVTGTKKSIIGVHNGGIGNHKDLAEKANAELLAASLPKFEYSVDSNALFMYLACGGDPGKVYGTGAIVWWDWSPGTTRRLNFLRFNTEALHIAKLEDESVIWCSTKYTLEKAARMGGLKILFHYDIKGDTHYQLQPELLSLEGYKPADGYPIVNMGKMVFGVSSVPSTATYGYSSSRTDGDEVWSSRAPYTGRTTGTTNIGAGLCKIAMLGLAVAHDTFDDRDIEEAHNKVVFGNAWQRWGVPAVCAICGEAYVRVNNPGFVLRSKSNYICGSCINDVWLELLDGMTSNKLPLILGVTASGSTDTLEMEKVEPNGNRPERPEENLSIIPTGDSGAGDTGDGSLSKEDSEDCYAEFNAFGC